MARLNPLGVLVDQWRYLINHNTGRPAWGTRTVLGLLPAGLGAASYFCLDWRMRNTGNLLAAVSLMAGVFLAAFAAILTIRTTLFNKPPVGALTRRAMLLLDESALTLLAAALFAGLDAVYLAAVTGGYASDHRLRPDLTAVAVFLSSYVALYFLLAVRRLHAAYTDAFPPPWKLPPVVRPEDDSMSRRMADRGVRS